MTFSRPEQVVVLHLLSLVRAELLPVPVIHRCVSLFDIEKIPGNILKNTGWSGNNTSGVVKRQMKVLQYAYNRSAGKSSYDHGGSTR